MPRSITQYRVFIGSPGGLEEERRSFKQLLDRYSIVHAGPHDVMFHPVGWEDTTAGVGRPQELINEDLKQCDYAVFVLHDRWGSPTGPTYSSGTEEEFALAEELYRAAKIYNIALFFKDVDKSKRNDPGPQLKAVLEFKRRIEDEKRYLFRQYVHSADFTDALEVHLASWLRDHHKTARGSSMLDPVAETASSISGAGRSPTVEPTFDYWINEAKSLAGASTPDYARVLFCAEKAIDASSSDTEWAEAKNHWGVCQFQLGKLDEAMAAFMEVADRLGTSQHPDHRTQVAGSLFGKGSTLDKLGRNQDALAAYDDLLARFGSAVEPALREPVALALYNKVFTLDKLGRSQDALAACDDLLSRFGSATEPALREIVDDARPLRDTLRLITAR